jgi:hypothetical protein
MQAGLSPAFLAAIPDPENAEHSSAIVINSGSHDASFFDQGSDGQVTRRTVAVHPGANSWAVSPSGRWAIAWSNAKQVAVKDPTEGFQDVTVIDLSKDPPVPTRLTVGYRPSKVAIDTASTRASIVTELGVSVIALGDAVDVIADFDFVAEEADTQSDTSITPDGKLALARDEGKSAIRIVSLETGDTVKVELPGVVTDLDLTSDGSLAIAVIRQSSEVALLSVPRIFEQPNAAQLVTIDGDGVVGSVTVSDEGDRAFIFTNAVESDRLTILDLATQVQRTVKLKAPIQAAFSAPDATHAIALLQPAVGSTRGGAFAVIPAEKNLPPKIQSTDAPPIAVAMVSTPVERALVTVSDPIRNVYGVYLVRMPELRVDFQPLASPPLATGVITDESIGFVAQAHAEGRISFVDLETGGIRTLTGFELAAKVVE